MTRAKVDEEVLREIKRIVLEEVGKLGIKVEKVILFGSRARGEAREDSDWDILVVVGDRIDRRVRGELSTGVRVRLLDLLGVPVDVVIVSEEHWRRYHKTPGTILYPASREGIPIA